jgi:FkbM family methyltransferase
MKSVLRRILSFIIKPFGYSLIATSQMHELRRLAAETRAAVSLEIHLTKLLQQHLPDCVFDVGANNGGFAKMLRSLGYDGWIVSFEPLQELWRDLQKAAEKDGKWLIEPYALGAVAGHLNFNQMAGDIFSSFLAPGKAQPEKYQDSNLVVKTLLVPVKTVSKIWPEMKQNLGVEKLMLKMDTQGFDLEVFAGARDCLQDIPLLMSELSCVPVYENAPDFLTSISTFAKEGYRPAILAPISFTEDLCAIEMDGIFVKSV